MSFQRREALATLRYAIDARKGLTLLIGEAGTGKSTLLRELERELGTNVTCVSIADPRATLADLLRSLLNQLQMERLPTDDPALIQQGLAVLRSHAEAGRLVAVILDEAHHMDDRQLELIVPKLAGPGSEKSQAPLAQLILAGRPELKERLFQAPLRSLGSMVAIECKLAALTAKEVGDYIAHRLHLADLEPGLFDNDAIQQVAIYSDGKLALVNILCDRVLEMADRSPLKLVNARLIEAAAEDLNLWKPRWVRKEAPQGSFAMPKESHGPVDFEFMHDTTESVGQTFVNFNDNANGKVGVSRAAGRGRTLGIISILVILGVSTVWLQAEPMKKHIQEWRVVLGEIISPDRQNPAPTKTEVHMPALPTAEELVSSVPLRSTKGPESQDESQKTGVPPAPETDKVTDLLAPITPPVQQETASAQQPAHAPRKTSTRAAVAKREPPPRREDPEQQKRELATLVSKAIANRAIPGIGVSVIDGTAYLDGRVATERQRTAAERAAQSVPDVREVRNRITIE